MEKHRHAISQIGDAEAARLLVATAHSPEHARTLRIVRGVQVSPQEALERWSMTTPEGPLHRVAIVSLVDREPVVIDHYYRDESDAIDVFDDILDALREAQEEAAAPA